MSVVCTVYLEVSHKRHSKAAKAHGHQSADVQPDFL